MSTILGISAFYHDSAACILKDGKIIAAAQEERFSRKKHDPSYPKNAIEFVLDYSNLSFKAPTSSIDASNVSPLFMTPTPAGVPVNITSPGLRITF